MLRREWGTGSVWVTRDGRWRTSVSLGIIDGRRKRKVWQFSSREAAEAKLREVQASLARGLHPSIAVGHRREVVSAIRPRMSRADAVKSVMRRAAALGWDEDFTALAIVASLGVNRPRYGVTGPCVYCGNELADCVDHVDPNGGDGPENVVSACKPCNSSKGHRTPAEWRGNRKA